MTSWQLEPERVRGVLRAVEDRRESLDGALREHRASAIVLGVSGGGWPVAAVSTAVDALIADQVGRLQRMRSHIDAGVVGTSLAVAAYEAGQEDMAAGFQREVVAAAASGDLSAFAPYLEP